MTGAGRVSFSTGSVFGWFTAATVFDLLFCIGLSFSRRTGGLFGGAATVVAIAFLLFTDGLLSFGPEPDADAELLRRFGPCELDESESELDEFESEPLELSLDDDDPELEQLDSDELTDYKRLHNK